MLPFVNRIAARQFVLIKLSCQAVVSTLLSAQPRAPSPFSLFCCAWLGAAMEPAKTGALLPHAGPPTSCSGCSRPGVVFQGAASAWCCRGVWFINQLLTMGLAAPAVWHPLPSVTGGAGAAHRSRECGQGRSGQWAPGSGRGLWEMLILSGADGTKEASSPRPLFLNFG